MPQQSRSYKILVYSLVFFSGFANLATEIIGPRLIASLFGSTTIIWAIIISVTLIGISVGYFIGGRVKQVRVVRLLPWFLFANAGWLLVLSWLIWKIPAEFASVGYLAIGITSVIAFFPPAVLFSITSPLAISLLALDRPKEELSIEVGNIYALGTLGSVLGALSAAFVLIPYVGLSASLKIFAILATLFGLVFLPSKRRLIGIPLLIVFLILPQPVYLWGQDLGLTLLAQREGYYQTIRVFTDNINFVQMNLGPTFHTQMRLIDKEPVFGYAAQMIRLAGDVKGKQILIVGGAGHTQARALEKRGASVTEVEIDPFVIQLSDQFFGKIHGPVVVSDGRTYLNRDLGKRFDFIFVDAFDSLASVPPQLITHEFFQAADQAMKPDGRLIYNFIGVQEGPRSNSYQAISATIASIFADTRAYSFDQEELSNIILLASQTEMEDVDFPKAPASGRILTDDLNPAEIYFEQARAGYYFH
jgi:spermidine synthase